MRVTITPEMLRRWAERGESELTVSGRLAVPSESFLKRNGRRTTARRALSARKPRKTTTTAA
jgi:hypothetical protein